MRRAVHPQKLGRAGDQQGGGVFRGFLERFGEEVIEHFAGLAEAAECGRQDGTRKGPVPVAHLAIAGRVFQRGFQGAPVAQDGGIGQGGAAPRGQSVFHGAGASTRRRARLMRCAA
jgi:hypothetical protein